MSLELTVNGRLRVLDDSWAERMLIEALREELGLHGVKNGCGIGACGACTVLVGSRPRRACVTPVSKALGAPIRTIEGLSGPGGELHPMQRAFVDAGAVQCGFCTPGMVLSAVAYVENLEGPATREGAAKALKGNLCRCTGYDRILEAVLLGAANMGEEREFAP